MTIDPLDKDEIAIVIAHAFGKKVMMRAYGMPVWVVTPFNHNFDFDRFEYLTTDETIFLVGR